MKRNANTDTKKYQNMKAIRNLTCGMLVLAALAAAADLAAKDYADPQLLNDRIDYTDGPFSYTILDKEAKTARLAKVDPYAYLLYEDGKWDPDAHDLGPFAQLDPPKNPVDIVIPPSVEIDGVSYEVTAIHYECFKDIRCIRSLELPQTIRSMGGRAFFKAGILHINLPESIDSIGSAAFDWSYIKSLVIPNKVKRIHGFTIAGMPLLHTAVLGKNVDNIDGAMVTHCPNLKELYVMNPEPAQLAEDPFWRCQAQDVVVFVPEESLSKYPRRPDDKLDETWENWYNTWAFFHDYRPIPDLFVVVDDDKLTLQPGFEDRLFTTMVNYADVTIYSDKWDYDPTMLRIEGDVVKALDKEGVTEIKRVIETSSGTYESKPIKIVIKTAPAGVEEIGEDFDIDNDGTPKTTAVDEDHCFFTIDGMAAGSDADRLAPGIYIERDHGKTRKFIKH